MKIRSLLKLYLTGIFSKRNIYHKLPEVSSSLSVEELLDAIQQINSPEELAEIEFLIDLMSFDGEFSEDERFALYSRVAYYYSVLIFIDDNFPHDYYPPFSVEAHIKFAETELELDAISLHLQFYKNTYKKRTGAPQYLHYHCLIYNAQNRQLKQGISHDKTIR